MPKCGIAVEELACRRFPIDNGSKYKYDLIYKVLLRYETAPRKWFGVSQGEPKIGLKF